MKPETVGIRTGTPCSSQNHTDLEDIVRSESGSRKGADTERARSRVGLSDAE